MCQTIALLVRALAETLDKPWLMLMIPLYPHFLCVRQLQVDNRVQKPSQVPLVANFTLETVVIFCYIALKA